MTVDEASPPGLEFRRAGVSDLDRVHEMVAAFYVEERYPYDADAARAAIAALLDDARNGWLWIVEADGEEAGYLAVTLGFSLEYGGCDAFIDELWVHPSKRGRGIGRAALEFAADAAARAGVRALHLEVERRNSRAADLYAGLGWSGNDRVLMTRRLG